MFEDIFGNEYVFLIVLGFLACWESDRHDEEEGNK